MPERRIALCLDCRVRELELVEKPSRFSVFLPCDTAERSAPQVKQYLKYAQPSENGKLRTDSLLSSEKRK